MTDFGKFLRKLRIDRNERLYDMAQHLEVSSAFLSSIENGKKSVPFELVSKIITIYCLDNEQAELLRNTADATAKQIRLSLNNTNTQKRDLALSFARRFDKMGQDEIQKILRILNASKEEN